MFFYVFLVLFRDSETNIATYCNPYQQWTFSASSVYTQHETLSDDEALQSCEATGVALTRPIDTRYPGFWPLTFSTYSLVESCLQWVQPEDLDLIRLLNSSAFSFGKLCDPGETWDGTCLGPHDFLPEVLTEDVKATVLDQADVSTTQILVFQHRYDQ